MRIVTRRTVVDKIEHCKGANPNPPEITDSIVENCLYSYTTGVAVCLSAFLNDNPRKIDAAIIVAGNKFLSMSFIFY
jgi:hypothetical protein